jgi:hypothetical protein
MVLLLWLDVLVLSLSGEQMLSGLHGLMTPLGWLGADIRRLALRLALTLQAIERLEQGQVHAGQEGAPGRRGNLRRLFDPIPEEGGPERVVLTHYPIRRRDVWIPMLVLAGFGALVWTGGWK